MYLIFYKSTLTANVAVSFAAAVLLLPAGIKMSLLIFSLSILSGGSMLSLLYRNYFKAGEYYFYYNQSLGKIQLILVAASLNFVLGIMFIRLLNFYGR